MDEGTKPVRRPAPPDENDDFLLREGFDLIAAFRAIQSEDARKAVIQLVAAIVQAEHDAAQRPDA